MQGRFHLRQTDLIEPYWNVKGEVKGNMDDLREGFNRTILECKANHENRCDRLRLDLIEPYWNVKHNHVIFTYNLAAEI